MYKKICAQCGKEFESDSWQVVCCSLECYRQRKIDQYRARREKKISISQLKDIALKEQSQRISELEAALEKSVRPNSGEIANLNNEILELKADLARYIKENSELKIQCEALERKLAASQKPDKKSNGKKADPLPDKALEKSMQRCERMGVSANELPCGERSYCWGKNKCEKNPLNEKPSDLLLDKIDKGFKA